jgi:hypothetical protein
LFIKDYENIVSASYRLNSSVALVVDMLKKMMKFG